jgi:hypothetical protein
MKTPSAKTTLLDTHKNSFINNLVIRHGPTELLGPFFLEADTACRQAGVTMTVGTFDELVRLNHEHAANWGPLIPLFDPANGAIASDHAFALIGRNTAGEAVAAHAARFFQWPDSTFREEAESLRLFYADPAAMKRPGETCTVTAKSAREVAGRVVYSGAAWVRPDFRGRSLALIMPRIAKAYAYTLWKPDFIVSWMTEPTFQRGLLKHVGYTSIDWAIEMKNSFVGDMRFAFLSMRESCLLDYVQTFSPDLATKIDGRVGQRRTQ